MTVSSTSCRTSATGTASAGQVIPFTFPIVATSDLLVYKRVTATGVATALAETTDYSVTITGSTGGSVTLVAAAGTTATVHIIRDTPDTQAVDLAAGGDFSAEVVEAALDKLTKLYIELEPLRTIHAPATDTIGTSTLVLPSAVSRASTYLGFNASGDLTCTTSLTTGTATFGAFGTTLVANATAADARTDLELSPGTDVQAYSTHLAQLVSEPKTANNFLVADGTTYQSVTQALAQTAIGMSAFIVTLIDDTTAAAARATLEIDAITDIVCVADAVVCNANEVVTI